MLRGEIQPTLEIMSGSMHEMEENYTYILKDADLTYCTKQTYTWNFPEIITYSADLSQNIFSHSPLVSTLIQGAYMYMYIWVALLCTCNYDNIVNRLYTNVK